MMSRVNRRLSASQKGLLCAVAGIIAVVALTWASLRGADQLFWDKERMADAPVPCPTLPCVVPLFVAVLNDASAIVELWQAVVLHNAMIDHRIEAQPCAERPGQWCYINLHILDNVDCDMVALIDAAPEGDGTATAAGGDTQPYFDAAEHLLRGRGHQGQPSGGTPDHHPGWASSAHATCQHWAAVKASLLGFDRVVVTTAMASMSFGQSMNWFMRTARRVYRQGFFLWAHTDALVDDFHVLGELLIVAQQLRCSSEPFSYVLTAYDALCVVHADAILRYVGMYDTFMWYYGEVDLMLRAELSGLPMLQLPTNAVRHVSMSSMRRGASTRFERMMRLRLSAWRAYYQARWASEFHVSGIETLNVTYAYVQLLSPAPCAFPSLRGFVDRLATHLRAPRRLTIRGATFAAHDATTMLRCDTTATSTNQGACLGGNPRQFDNFVFYFLPVVEFDAWVDRLVAGWEASAATTYRLPNLVARNETMLAFTKAFGIRRLEFFSQGFDKK